MENESEKELAVAEPIDTEEESVDESDEMEFSDTEESEENDNQDIPAEDDDQVKAIQESLKQGTVKRNKKEGKSLVVKDAITVNQVYSYHSLSIAIIYTSFHT